MYGVLPDKRDVYLSLELIHNTIQITITIIIIISYNTYVFY
jgi:hypothetical protein